MIIDHKPGNQAMLEKESFPSKKILDVVVQREMTTYLHRSLPMCIFLANENYRGWYNTNYVQIFSHTNSCGEVELNYLSPRDGYLEISENICLGFPLLKNEPDIVAYVMEHINRGYYFVAHLDEFYIPEKGAYLEDHFVHASLVYGYDQEKEVFYGIGFDEDMTFTDMTFDFSVFYDAYEGATKYYEKDAAWCEWSAFQLIKPKTPDRAFPFSLKRFTDELDDFVNCKSDHYMLYSFEYDKEDVSYGLEAYQVTIKCLKDMINKEILIDYRAIHLICEHITGLLDRFNYIEGHYLVSLEYRKLLKEFEEIDKMGRNLRLKCMGELYHVTVSEDITEKKQKLLAWAIEEIQQIGAKEKEILTAMVSELKNIVY